MLEKREKNTAQMLPKDKGIGGPDLEWVLSVLDKDDSGDISLLAMQKLF